MLELAFTLPSLVEEERKQLLSQRKKAYSLIFLMIMLAQTSYIGAMEGWKYLDQTNASNIGPGCDLIARASGTPIHVDPEIGSNDWNGTWSCPLATLQEAVNVSSANDEIILASGLYHENVSISNKDNLLIRAADGATVVFDGTRSIASDMNVTWSTADSDGIQEVTLPQDGWQLFLAYDEQVPARWPNAGFDDETVFNRSYWAEGILTGSNNAYTKGWLTDAGPEAGVHTGLNETVNASGLDPVGAIAILNLGSFRSNSRIITDWNPNNGTFAYDGDGVGWKTKHHAYFLEGKRELIDVDGEWWYNNTNNRLHYKTPSGQDANDLDLRVKVQPFAISVDGSDGVTIQGIDFFGTTVNFNNCDGCSFTNATLEYPSTSKRGLGIAGESEDDRWMTRFYRSKNSFVDNISITNTDGGAIEFHGSGGQSHNNTINNSYFHAIDWSAADQKGLMTTIYEGGRDMYFTNNSVHLTGASSVLSIGDAPKVFYNEVWDVGYLQTDGAVVQVMQGEAPGAEIAYNWIHDVIKYGARFDAPIGQAGEGRNGTMHHNVIWNAAGGLMVKGDYHDIHNNTVFNSTGKNDIIFLTDGGINNKNSTLHRNAVDSVADHRSDDVFANPLPNGSHWSNWNGYVQGYADMFEARNQISCAIYDNGSLYCWGRNDHGQLGLGYTSGREDVPQYVDLGTGRTITSLGVDDSGAEGWTPNSHACAVLDNGDLVCWGANGDGQLGIGNTSTNGVWEPTTVNVGSGLTAISVATGNSATCALLSDHSVKCWGKNNLGQLGLGNSSNNDVLTPHTVTFNGASTPLSVHAGRNEFCAQLDNGSAACWGQNADGQFGLGNTTSQTSPIALTLPTGRTIASMSMAKDFICITLDNGSVVCAGRNTEFQIGQGTISAAELSWKYVIGLDMVAHSVELGQDVGCAHLVNGSMACWGEDVWGLFGNSTTSYTSRVASTATQYANFGNGRTAASISLNYRHACAVLDNGDLTCWGRNHKAQLGLGNITQQFMPVVVSNVSSIRQVQIHEMLVDPANADFRPTWGSPLHQLGAGAYDAGDADPWTAGVSWTYSPMSDPISGCMDSIAINYNSNAIFGDGSCTYTTLSSSSTTLSLEMNTAMTPYTLTYSTPFLADDTQTAASSGSVGAGTNIALDSNGAVHICSKTVTTDNLYYTTNASGSWQSATLDSSGNVGGDCFIILDSDDDIHITYRDDSNTNLKYATKALSDGIAASNWVVSTMDNNGDVGNFGSMVVDANDTLHVAYYSANGAALKYATLADGSTTWSREVVESTNDVGKYTSIALDSNGNPHITYFDDTNNDLRYTHKMGSSWTFTTLDSTAHTGKGTSLAIDSNDHLHVAYKTNSTEIAYMTNRTGSWVKTTLDANSTGTWGVNYINIMLDEGDDPHVTYSDMVDYDVFYMSNTRGMWERILVAGDSISKSSEAAMDENGGIHVAYYIDGSFDDIGYAAVRSLAHRPQFEIEPDLPNGVLLGAENGTLYGTPSEYLDLTEYTVWANTTRTSAFTTFSMNVDWELMSSVDYLMTPRNTAITPITFNWTAWTSGVLNSTSSVYTSGNSGDYNSIAVDSNDKVHIVFYRDDNSNLYHATNASGSWSTSSIETNNNVGKYCSIAIDSNDGLHVSYQYNTGNALKYAYKASGSSTWSRTTVDNTGGKFTSIAVDSNDKPHIAYRDSGGDVGYAEKTGSSWTFGTVQSAGDIASTSIAIDSDDHIHIAYFDSNNKDMYHLTNTSGSWVRTFLEDIGSLSGGMAVDIAIDPTTDQPGISYFDKDATALKYTYYTGSTWSSAVVENGADYGRFNSIAYDSLGNVHISHERNSADDLYYTSDKTGSWVSTAIHTTNSAGLYTAIAVDSNDDIHIAYRYNSYYDVYHATVQGYKTGSVARTAVTGATCSITPSLPNGLTLNQGTCTISGTPTSHGSNTTYNVTATSSTGVSKSGEFNLWITQIAPSITYSGSPFTFTVGTAISSITPTNTGDTAFWSVSPSLPSGLSLGAGGVISGTPTVQASAANYIITASNPGGESSATISITVNEQAPGDISYSPENMTLEKGTAMTPNLPSTSGGTITSWQISPSLPSGLTWGTTDGKISGTPSVLQTIARTYTIWANNSGGSTSAQVNITINDEAPDIAYSPDWFVLTNNTAMQATTPTNSGGAIPSAFFGYTGDAKATSIAVDSSGHKHVSYRDSSGLRYATDASGSWVTVTVDTASAGAWNAISSIAIDSNDVLHISYNVANSADLKYATCSSSCTTASNWNNVSIDTSGAVGYYTSIALDSNDALHISYFDDTNKDLKYATCSSGCTTASNWNIVSIDTSGAVGYYTSIALDSNDALHISYFDDTNTNLKYATCSSSCTTASNWNAVSVDSFGSSIFDPEVRTDIAIDSNDGVHISYFDNTNDDLKYATCSSGCTTASNWNKVSVDTTGDVGYSASIGIDSNDGLHISYSDKTNNNLNYATCSNACTTASNWNNETVDSSSVLTGEYTSIAIDANDGLHISYFDDSTNKIRYLALDSSSNILGYSVSPDLPTGLRLDPMIGKISGTPTELSTNTTYTITARNSGGVNTTTITIQVNDLIPNALGYTPENMTLEKGTTMTTNTPSVSGGAVTSWEIDPSLPSGLSFGSTNGSIWGTPTILQTTAVAYTIWANNSGGSETAQVNITINDQIASVSYPSTVEISNDRTMTTVTPTNTGGAVTSWAIVPSLPSGLNFGSSNGSIWGTPSGLLTNATYTVYGNNSGGSSSTTFTLGLNWTLTPSAEGAYITRNSSLSSDITWEWDYDPLEAQNLSLATGEWNTCAVRDNGDVYCWGRNGNGQIGNGQTGTAACGTSGHKCKDQPTQTNSLGSDAVSIAFGHQHACALLDNGAVKCWGRNNAGQLGVSGGDKNTPQTVNLGTGRTAMSIYAGGHYTCAILDDASVKCWGQNDYGQLGIGSNSNTNTPTSINSLGTGRTAVSLATAFSTVCALLDDGSVKCWGRDNFGQLGDGSGSASTNSPPSSSINLETNRTAKAITGGEFHFCAILDDDSIKCWGRGVEGQLGSGGTGGTYNSYVPSKATGSLGTGRYAVAIDAGYDHTCALLDNGDVNCWGSDAQGQLGNGATSSSNVASLISSNSINLGTGRTAISISAGGTHTCAQLDDGKLKCWGNRADGQVGDNGGFNGPSDRTSPSAVSHGYTYLDTGAFPSNAVSGATCSISPSLPTGLSLTSGTCTITGTPTATATNATYTIWANISGQSFSGQIWLEVGLNAPDISYSSSTFTYTKDSTISTLNPINVGGEVTTWAINATLPSGLSFGTSNGSIWGTPDTVTAATNYTIWANNSAGSNSTIITFTVNDPAPNFYYGGASSGGYHPLVLYLNQTMNALTPTTVSGGGTPTSCSSSPSLPSGITLSSSCVISGTPNATDNGVFYTITGTNTGGSDVGLVYIVVRSYGGTLTITPTSREGEVNSALSNITMSYTHSISNYGWTSGVSNTTISLATNYDYGNGVHWLGADSGEQGELVVVYARKDSTTTTHSLAMLYRWNGTWTETILDNGTNTGHHPSVAIDRQGAIHIAYIDDNNDKLRYATNASGSWVFTTLGNSTIDLDNAGEPRLGRGTAIVVHPITDAVHIVATNYVNSSRGLSYHTNEGGSWVNETITDMTKDEGHDPAMAMGADGNLYVAHYCSSGCADLRLSSRINGVWQNETVSSSGDIGSTPDIAIDSQGTIHIVSKYAGSNGRVYLHSGTPGSWTENTGLGGAYPYWPVVGVDSNDAVHISYHLSWTYKDVMYMTNASGSWSTPSKVEEYGGWGSEMVIDANDDIFIPNIHPGSNGVSNDDKLQLTTVQGYGQGLTARPIYDVSPMLPDGLKMNWRNGTISGTPTQALANTTFTVTVTALGANTTGTFTLYITGEPGIITYTDIQASNQTAITTATPSFTNNSTSGTATTWAISPTLPNGLSFGTANGSIWGTPTLEQIKTSYTVWANNTAGSSSTTINITIGPMAPGPFEYNPENNTWTNNTEVHLAPQFINQTTGNGSTWQVADIRTATSLGSLPGLHMKPLRIGDTLYFSANDGSTGHELWAYNLTNQSTWQVADIRSGSADSNPGFYSSIVLGDTLYFSANDGSTGYELWAHKTSNGTTWQVANIRPGSSQSNPGSNMMHVVNGVLYFNAHDGNKGLELWKHDPSTGTTSRVYDINAGSTGSSTGKYLNTVIGDVLYFSANDGSTGSELWAYNTSNSSDPWRVMDINSGSGSSNPGEYMQLLVGDTLYFSAHDGSTGQELWAHDTSNHSTWEVAEINTWIMMNGMGIGSNPGEEMAISVGDTIYFSAYEGSMGEELWAHDTSNHSTWQVADINTGSGNSGVGEHLLAHIGSTIYFNAYHPNTGQELWAHNTLNKTTWQVIDIYSGTSGSVPGQRMDIVVGDTIYFDAWDGISNYELWAHDTSNGSTWRVTSLSGSFSSEPGYYMSTFADDVIYLSANSGNTGHELWAHRPFSINYQTNTGGNVTTWAINASLPSGVSFGTNNGTIYGTPTELWTQTSYMVWANNSGGSSVAYLNITVNDVAPVISYSTTEITGTIDVALSPHVGPTTSGGTITSWEISPDPGSAFHFNSNNGYISGTPSILLTRTQYTIWANNSGGSSVAYVNVTINDVAPGPFEYNPENNTWTNNTEVHLAPQFINQTTGNGSTWQVANINSGSASGEPGRYMRIIVGDTLYFSAHDGSTGIEMWAHDTSNRTTWQVADINSGSGDGYPGLKMAFLVGDTLYFDAQDGSTGFELWAYDTSNQSLWQVTDIRSGSPSSSPGYNLQYLMGDTLYFDAQDGSTGIELWAHNTSNGTTWQVADISGGSGHSWPGSNNDILVGDTIYFSANDGSTGNELWAHDTSNHSTWRVTDVNSGAGNSIAGDRLIELVGNTIYFSAYDGSTSLELWAHDTSNHSTWQVADINSGSGSSNAGLFMHQVVGDTIYFSADDGSTGHELWAHDTSNGSTWRVADINSGSDGSAPGWHYGDRVIHQILAGDTIYFPADDGITGNELWAYDTSNRSLWQVADINSGSGDGNPGSRIFLLIGDTIYFRAHTGQDWTLWAHDTSNHSTWQVTNISSGSNSVYLGNYMRGVVLGDTIYFDADDGSTGQELWAHNPSSINYQTNTGGNVTTWAINASLPSGLFFGTNNGTIYGTPTELWTQTSYMVWANNSGGSSIAYLNITVVDEVPTLSYSPSTLVLTKGNQSSDLPLNATLTGSGTITSWAINATLPTGLNFGTTNGTIWGIPTVLQTTATTYTIWANNSGGSSSFTITLTINDVAPGPFEYNPENNTWTNNTEVYLAPQFINQTTGNGSTWQVVDIWTYAPTGGYNSSAPGSGVELLVGDTMYFAASTYSRGKELWAHNTSNGTTWLVSEIRPGISSSGPGASLSLLVGDTLYFSADDGSKGIELWAHDTSNRSTWRVTDINSGSGHSRPGQYMQFLVGDTIYFSADDGSTGQELWAHNTSSHSTWRVADIRYGSSTSSPGQMLRFVLGDTIYFSASDGSTGNELWSHNTSSNSTSRVIDLNSGSVNGIPTANYMNRNGIVVGDTIYFSGVDGSGTGMEMWAHDTSNDSTWRVTDINSGGWQNGPGYNMAILVGDTIYFDADDPQGDGNELWAHNVANGTTWQVTDISSGLSFSYPGDWMSQLVGDTLYFSSGDTSTGAELWAHDTSNHSTWQVADINSGTGGSRPGYWMEILVGDTLYFSAGQSYLGHELWAHDTSNGSTWRVEDINTGSGGSDPGFYMYFFHGDTLYFSADDGSTGHELWAHRPFSINYQTNTGGNVTTWAINASLPSGVSFGTNNGTIYGTPTELWTQTSYMVWANNSGGSSVAYLNITVVDELPTLSYSPENLTLTKGQPSSDLPLNATLTGPGEIITWEINATLPAGLNFGTSNGTIWGIPTVLQTTATTYTIWANNSGGSTSATVTITINDEAPGPFEYIPENNTWTNNSYVNIGPSFINQTSGNGSSWAVSLPITDYAIVVGDVVYLNGAYIPFSGDEFYAFNTSNGTAWAPNPTWYLENGSTFGHRTFNHGRYMSYLIGDVIYFDAECKISWCDQFGVELWAYNTSNNSGWLVKEINTVNINNLNFSSNPGELFSTLIGDTIYFSAYSGNASLGTELWAHDTSNGTTWRVGVTNTTGLPSTSAWPRGQNLGVIDDTFYFQAWGSGGNGLWAYNTSNTTMWRTDISSGVTSSNPGKCMALVVGDTLYFDADGGYTGRELWAHNHVNQTSWLAKDFRTTNYNSQLRDGNRGCSQTTRSTAVLYEDTIYLVAMDQSIGLHLFAYDTSNHSAWPVVGTNNYYAGQNLLTVIGDTIYFDAPKSGLSYVNRQLWAHDTSNKTSWIVHDFSLSGGQGISKQLMVVGDTIYFRACGYSNCYPQGLWAHDTSNQSTWLVENGSGGDGTSFFVGGTLYTHTGNCNGYSPGCTLGYNLLSINYQTNTGGNVTTWAINGSLPSGLSFGTNNGTIYGTPTELWTQTSYMVWANNSGGSSVAYLNITIVDDLPTLSYAPSTLVLTINNQSSDLPLNASLTGAGHHHLVGNQRNLASWTQLRYEQRNDLGYSDRSPDHGDNLHDLGQQLGRFNFGHHHDYDQRRSSWSVRVHPRKQHLDQQFLR